MDCEDDGHTHQLIAYLMHVHSVTCGLCFNKTLEKKNPLKIPQSLGIDFMLTESSRLFSQNVLYLELSIFVPKERSRKRFLD